MSLLVFNADDAGLAAGTDAAILRCAAAGVVRAATVVVNGPTAAAFVAEALDAGVDIGLHVNLTQGEALAGPQRTLTDDRGRFPGKAELWRRAVAGALDPAALRAEVTMQWERIHALGAAPTHVDGHNHVHVLPGVRPVLAELADACWIRVPVDLVRPPADLPGELTEWADALRGPARRTERFTGYAFAADPSVETLVGGLDPGARSTECMVHPGARPGSPFTSSALRERETEVLCSDRLSQELDRRGFRVASFVDLPCA